MKYPTAISPNEVNDALSPFFPSEQVLCKDLRPGIFYFHLKSQIKVDIEAALQALQSLELDFNGRKLPVF